MKPIFNITDMRAAYNMGRGDAKEYEFNEWLNTTLKNKKVTQ